MKNLFKKFNISSAYTLSLIILTLIFLSSCEAKKSSLTSDYKLVLPNDNDSDNEPLYSPRNKNMYNGKPVKTYSNINKNNITKPKEIETYSDLSSSIRNSLELQPQIQEPKRQKKQPVYKQRNEIQIESPKMHIPTEVAINKKESGYHVKGSIIDNNKKRKSANRSAKITPSNTRSIEEIISSNDDGKEINKVQNKVLEILSNDKIQEKEKQTIAILLPLSGKYSKIGKNLLNSAEMAIFDMKNPNLILKKYDTKASPKGARKAFNQAIKDNATIVLGPVFSRSTKAVIPLSQKTKIPVISYSNDVTLAGNGIFLLGYNPLEQIRKVVEFAHSQNIKFFASIAPENDYGILTTKVLSDYLHNNKLKPANMQWYLKADESLSKSLTILSKQTEEFPPLSVALLVPEGGRTLSSISKRLFDGNLKNSQFRLLGSGEWDSSKVINNKKLEGSWFATSPSKNRKIFRKKFVDNFGYTPIKIASIAYDSIVLTNDLLSNNSNISDNSIISAESFKGVNGLFRFNKDGTTKRSLSVIEITNRGFAIAKPANNSF